MRYNKGIRIIDTRTLLCDALCVTTAACTRRYRSNLLLVYVNYFCANTTRCGAVRRGAAVLNKFGKLQKYDLVDATIVGE